MKIIEYTYFNINREIKNSVIIVKDYEELKRYLKFKEKILIKIKLEKNYKKMNKKDQNNFFFSIGKLLKAQIPLKKSLELQLEACKDIKLISFYKRVIWKLDLGEDIFSILKEEKIITSYEELLMYIFENSGDLSEGFLKINEFREKEKKLNSEILSALIYPILIIVVSSIIIFFMLIFIVPNFIEMYTSMDVDLPYITRIIVGLTKGVTDNYILNVVILILIIFTLNIYMKKMSFILRIPLLKNWILNRYLVEILEGLYLLIDSGFSLDKSIDTTLEGISKVEIKNYFIILKEIKKGYPLSFVLEEINLLSLIEINMIKVGEESGEISKMLKEVVYLKKEIMERKIQIYLKLVEPLLLLLIGIIIGFFVIGLYLPILNISETIL